MKPDTLARVYIHYIRNGDFLDYCGLFANGMASAWKEYAPIKEYRKDFLGLVLNFWKIRRIAAIFHYDSSNKVGRTYANIRGDLLNMVRVFRGELSG